ncbi:MAG: PD-(D/E)XK nuclease family protein, partial [Vicinamibacteraceae bacterium]
PPQSARPEETSARWFTSRDREEELLLFARRLKAAGLPKSDPPPAEPSSFDPPPLSSLAPRPLPLDGVALVYNRPLPYLYLARQVLGGAGIPCQAFDALPLASEPYAAALDVVLEAVSSGFVRVAIVALLRSPHFLFVDEDQQPVTGDDVAALDRALVDAAYLGGLDHLCRLADRWSADASRPGARPAEIRAARAAGAAALAASELGSLESDAPPSAHLQELLDFLQRHARPGALEGDRPRQLRARAAIVGALEALRDAHRDFHDEPVKLVDLAAVLHRWIEAQTFMPRTGRDGLHLVDADAARYGEFASVHLAGLVDGEWPEAPTRNVFYPASLLIDLGWPREADRLAAARAAFHDLMGLPQDRLSVSSFLLEQDALVRPSALLEELDDLDTPIVRPASPQMRVSADEALSLAPVVSSAVEGEASAWLALRLSRRASTDPRFRGQTGPDERPQPEGGQLSRTETSVTESHLYSVTAVERYLQCPFKYFAVNELALEPDVEEEPGLSALQRGRLLHQVLRDFFARVPWRSELTVESMPRARQALTEVVDAALARLPEPDRTLERQRFQGTAVSTGLIDRILRAEIARPGRVTERLVEHSIEGRYLFEKDNAPRSVAVRGVVDRVDLVRPARAVGVGTPAEEQWLRVIDYKIGRAPRTDLALQPQIYGICLEQQLARERGGRWQVAEAGYLALGLPEPNVPVVRPGTTSGARTGASPQARIDTSPRTRVLEEATERFLTAVDAIERGDFRVAPAEPFLCVYCPFPTVCRKDYVGDE